MINRTQFEAALNDVVQGWNTGDRDRFVGGYRAMATGELRLENPVGGPVQTGWDVIEKLFDDHQPHVRVETERVIVNGGEAAAVMRNIRVSGGETVTSIETYKVGADGSLLVRYFNPHA